MNNENYIPHPFELFGVECGKGWYKLIEPVYNYIQEYNKDKNEENKIYFTQIKEKWGLLCIYTNYVTDELLKLIDEAEDKSQYVCEFCGSEKNVGCRETGWISTMCLDCVKKEVEKRNFPQTWVRNEDNKKLLINTDGSITEIKKN